MSDRRSLASLLRWRWQRLRQPREPLPAPEDLPRAEPRVGYPTAEAGEIRITWVGHSTFLIQAGGFNVLTDPIFSERASPVSWIGPRRIVPPGLALDELPPMDAVILSHDHYDHLDAPSVAALRSRFGSRVRWFTPRGYASWFQRRGITAVTELDWWGSTRVRHREGGHPPLRVTALPARHWSRRSPFDEPGRRWASFSIEAGPGARIYFAGDSGYFPGFTDIGRRRGPFDVAIMPVGAYEPRWFMHPVHMSPEEAVQAWDDLGGSGHFIPMHWGTFALTDEPVLDPPERTRLAWSQAARDPAKLSILRHGETIILRIRDDPETE